MIKSQLAAIDYFGTRWTNETCSSPASFPSDLAAEQLELTPNKTLIMINLHLIYLKEATAILYVWMHGYAESFLSIFGAN